MSKAHPCTHKKHKKKKRKKQMPVLPMPPSPPSLHQHPHVSPQLLQEGSTKKHKKRKRPSSTNSTATAPSVFSSPHKANSDDPVALNVTVVDNPSPSRAPPATSNKKKKKKKKLLSLPFSSSTTASSYPPSAPSMSNSGSKAPPRQHHTFPSPSPTTRPSLHLYPFPTEYADHFESPFRAYQDLEAFLVWLCRALGKQQGKPALHIYDPYYCQGAVVGLLGRLGFSHVTNKMRDFYADVVENRIPRHDVLVTNPPYSGDHKEKALRFCLASDRPFCLLLPNYVANKAYYLDAIASLPEAQKPFYLVPAQKYEYQHPQGTGHDSSPFFSVWFCHPGPLSREEEKNPLVPWLESAANKSNPPTWRVVFSVEGLRSTGATPSWKRPNNKRRKKMKLLAAVAGGGEGGV
ncbi:Hypothetical protein NocV09_02000390 [Nannochloropsis oceanica]